MSRDGSIELDWPDQARTYRLRLKELRELQEKCGDRGPQEIAEALASSRWRVDDVVQTIRLGLIGGGMSQADALAFVNRHVTDGQLGEARLPALAIVMAAITGAPDEKLKTPPGDDGGKPTAPEAGSVSATSTEQEPPSGSARDRLMN